MTGLLGTPAVSEAESLEEAPPPLRGRGPFALARMLLRNGAGLARCLLQTHAQNYAKPRAKRMPGLRDGCFWAHVRTRTELVDNAEQLLGSPADTEQDENGA